MKIKLLGAHNCETLEYRHTCMVIDDILALDAGSLTPGLSMEDQKQLMAVLLSHQHYDHIRDIIALGTNLYHAGMNIDIYSTSQVIRILDELFFSGDIYRNLVKVPEDNPTLRIKKIEPFVELQVEHYSITAQPVNHSAYTVGFYITRKKSDGLFYTSDTGPGLAECWRRISPRLLIIEVTESNDSTEFFRKAGHMTPRLLFEELKSFREIKGYLPDIVTVHMSPEFEEEIKEELEEISGELGCSISPGYEGMEIVL